MVGSTYSVAAVGAGFTAPGGGGDTGGDGGGGITTTSTTYLPFDMPVDSEFDASDVVVGVHLQTNFRRAINDQANTDATAYETRNWFPPGAKTAGGSETGRDVYGGLWRNGPLARAPLGGSLATWETNDKRWELQQMKAAGLRHVVACFLGEGDWRHTLQWGDAAVAESMPGCVILMPDSEVSIVRNGSANLVSHLLQCVDTSNPNHSGYAKHTDGRWLVMPYGPELAVSGGTSAQIIAYWKAVMQGMDAAGQPCALWPVFTRQWTTAANNTIPTFQDAQLAPWVVGYGRWGTNNPVETASTDTRSGGTIAHGYGKLGLFAWRTEDQRPNGGKFYEAGGWEEIVTGAATGFQPNQDVWLYVTWSDWAEGAASAPSKYWGWSVLDVMSYYVCKKRLDYDPPIIRDTLYLAHRRQQPPPVSAPTYTHPNPPYTSKMVLSGSTPARNEVDVLVFATASATVRITINGTNHDTTVAAGVSRVSAPLLAGAAGNISCKMIRSGSDVAGTSITSPYAVNFTTQLVQDLTYVRLSSRRPQTLPFTPV